jgi:putative ATPase
LELFEQKSIIESSKRVKSAPLYDKVRPKTLDAFLGQQAIEPFIDLIKQDKLPSLLLWGPPGCGKTTLAHIIKNITQKDFVFLSAVLSGVKELRETVERAKSNLKFRNRQTILFIDEIHRFNKAQQDAILPHLENGTFVLIGATTENPSFEINPALLSRTKVITFESLDDSNIEKIIGNVVESEELKGKLEPKALTKIATVSAGDARFAINLLETVLANISKEKITEDDVVKLLGSTSLKYDKHGEYHYNYISAFIKSVRGSDTDAAVYYLAGMLESGEDPKFIARRLIILASEDIGNADPRALQIALSALDAVHAIGMPEARIILAQATTYLATAPKSNASYMAINKALEDVKNGNSYPPPMHLRNPVTKLMKEQGYGKGYKYAHDYPYNIADQTHLPEEMKGTRYYSPTKNGYEKTISERLDFWRQTLHPSK